MPNGKKWEPKEDALLKRHWGSLLFDEICAMLPSRTPNAVRARAALIGLGKRDPSEFVRVSKAAQILAITRECVLKRIKAGKLQAKRHGGMWLIYESQLKPEAAAPTWESLSVKEAAEMLGVGVRCVTDICRRGWVDCYRYGPRKLWRVRKAHIAYGLKLMADHGFTKIPWYKLRDRIAQDQEFRALHKMEEPKIELQRSGPDAGAGRQAGAGMARAMHGSDAPDRRADKAKQSDLSRQQRIEVVCSGNDGFSSTTGKDHGPGARNGGQIAGGGNMTRFQSIMQIANSKAAEQEAAAAAVKRRRAEELREMARTADLRLDRRRGRKMGQPTRTFVNVHPKDFINALREWRAAHGLTQTQASITLEIELGTYKRYELKGISFIDPDYFQRLKKWGVQIEPIGENEQ